MRRLNNHVLQFQRCKHNTIRPLNVLGRAAFNRTSWLQDNTPFHHGQHDTQQEGMNVNTPLHHQSLMQLPLCNTLERTRYSGDIL
jgi:hypothetical protein